MGPAAAVTRPGRLGAGGDVVAADRGGFGLVVALDENGVRVKESAAAGVEIDLAAPQLERTITCVPGFTDRVTDLLLGSRGMRRTVRVHRTCATEFVMVGWLDRLQRKSRVAGFLIAVVYKYVDDQGSYLAALITYYAFVSLFPALLLLTTVVGVLLVGHPGLQEQILHSAVASEGWSVSRPSG